MKTTMDTRVRPVSQQFHDTPCPVAMLNGMMLRCINSKNTSLFNDLLLLKYHAGVAEYVFVTGLTLDLVKTGERLTRRGSEQAGPTMPPVEKHRHVRETQSRCLS